MLQAQQRSDMGRIIAALETYATNNNGSYPQTLEQFSGSFYDSYIGNSQPLVNPSGEPYEVVSTAPTSNSQLAYAIGYSCGDDDEFVATGSDRNVAVATFIETESRPYCVDNS